MPSLKPASARRSALDGRQIESAETLWISQRIDLNDLTAGNREAEHGIDFRFENADVMSDNSVEIG